MTAKSKFSARITHAKLPPKLKMPTIVKKYDGTTDPDDHMFDFDGAARVEQWSMPAWCFMFAQTLTGAARVWFDALNEGEINDFEEFQRLFLQNFNQQRHYSKEITEVHNIRKKDGESLDSFIDRFNRENMQISGVVDQLRISGFCHGVRNNQVVEKLHENLSKTMEVLMERARGSARGKNACNPAPESDHKISSWKKNGESVFDKTPSGSRGRLHPYSRNDRPHEEEGPDQGFITYRIFLKLLVKSSVLKEQIFPHHQNFEIRVIRTPKSIAITIMHEATIHMIAGL
ncbi:putative retrotransposon gag domain-containing protein [Helianthus anomalus]